MPRLREVLKAVIGARPLPHLRKIGDAYYNFWTDEENPRGGARPARAAWVRAGPSASAGYGY